MKKTYNYKNNSFLFANTHLHLKKIHIICDIFCCVIGGIIYILVLYSDIVANLYSRKGIGAVALTIIAFLFIFANSIFNLYAISFLKKILRKPKNNSEAKEASQLISKHFTLFKKMFFYFLIVVLFAYLLRNDFAKLLTFYFQNS